MNQNVENQEIQIFNENFIDLQIFEDKNEDFQVIRENLQEFEKYPINQLTKLINKSDVILHLVRGCFLFSIRSQLKANQDFGQWCKDNLVVYTAKQVQLDINYYKFFKDHDPRIIGLTAAYHLSAPKNSDVAEQVYEYITYCKLPHITESNILHYIKDFKQNKLGDNCDNHLNWLKRAYDRRIAEQDTNTSSKVLKLDKPIDPILENIKTIEEAKPNKVVTVKPDVVDHELEALNDNPFIDNIVNYIKTLNIPKEIELDVVDKVYFVFEGEHKEYVYTVDEELEGKHFIDKIVNYIKTLNIPKERELWIVENVYFVFEGEHEESKPVDVVEIVDVVESIVDEQNIIESKPVVVVEPNYTSVLLEEDYNLDITTEKFYKHIIKLISSEYGSFSNMPIGSQVHARVNLYNTIRTYICWFADDDKSSLIDQIIKLDNKINKEFLFQLKIMEDIVIPVKQKRVKKTNNIS